MILHEGERQVSEFLRVKVEAANDIYSSAEINIGSPSSSASVERTRKQCGSKPDKVLPAAAATTLSLLSNVQLHNVVCNIA